MNPIHYNVEFDFRLLSKYTVNYKLTFEIQETTKIFHLDSSPQFFGNFSKITQNEKEFKFTAINKKKNLMEIEFEKEIEKGIYELELKFTSSPTDNCEGVFRTSKDDVIYTQMESKLCSKVFPCCDNNWSKSFFEFSFIIPQDKEVISNMKISKETSMEDSLKLIQFNKTPKIPRLDHLKIQSTVMFLDLQSGNLFTRELINIRINWKSELSVSAQKQKILNQ
jgi:aminopeptidase N